METIYTKLNDIIGDINKWDGQKRRLAFDSALQKLLAERGELTMADILYDVYDAQQEVYFLLDAVATFDAYNDVLRKKIDNIQASWDVEKSMKKRQPKNQELHEKIDALLLRVELLEQK